MSERRLAFVYTPEIEQLAYPADCPFKTQRAGLTRQKLRGFGWLGIPGRTEVEPVRASREALLRGHSARYLDELERAAAGQLTVEGLQMGLGSADTPVFADLFAYGAWACGAALAAADLLVRNEADIAFSLLGGFHHAMSERAAGFCYLNDVVLACDRLATAGKRVFCLDIDAHHGDGTQAAFYQRSDVFTLSMHESGVTLFPWGGFENEWGEGEGLGFNVNVPLPAGTYDTAFLGAFERVVLPLVRAFGPDVMVLELGMDTLSGDPLTHLNLTNNATVAVIEHLLGLQLPLLVTGGGGYHVDNTVRGWALAWQAFAEEHHDLELGMGGVMLGNTDWAGGLRDHHLPVSDEQRNQVDPPIEKTVSRLKETVFPLHGL